MRYPPHVLALTLLVPAAAGPAPAQTGGQPAITPVQPGNPAVSQSNNPQIQRVEQGVADVGPLSLSTRSLGVDLRRPFGFDSVYAVNGDRNGGSFARISGGLFAVFPRSVYRPTKDGIMTEVPPGTVFYIGGLPSMSPFGSARPVVAPGPDTRVPTDATLAQTTLADMRAPSSVPVAAASTADKPQPAETERSRTLCVLTDSQYCDDRVQHLLARAAGTPGKQDQN
ncbi:MAG: hypothetical protein KF745_01410 [Phycisphaeraceae bacterium]|nr:hypothetical protein [Phycisphaeraceae bacterium]